MTKTLTMLCEEYNSWCALNDIDSYLRSKGFGEKRALSADELEHELTGSIEEMEEQRLVMFKRRAWVQAFQVDWAKAEEAERVARKAHAVYARHLAFGWTNVHVFENFNKAVGYIDSQIRPKTATWECHREYHHMDMIWVISPVEEE